MSTRSVHLVTKGNSNFVVSGISSKIIKSLAPRGKLGLSYEQLVSKTDSPLQTLYVIAGRLRKAGLLTSDVSKRTGAMVLVLEDEVVIQKAKLVHLQ